MNGRCGIGEGSDFGDPEYTTFSSVSPIKWESSAGMDPYSYGYNRATAAASYMNASTMINNLVDIVSKNGNYLLDIGYILLLFLAVDFAFVMKLTNLALQTKSRRYNRRNRNSSTQSGR